RAAPRAPLFPYTTLFRSCLPPSGSACHFYQVCSACRRFLPPAKKPAALPVLMPSYFAISKSSGTSTATHATSCLPPPFFAMASRSEEHTSELQSRFDLVC